MKNESELVYICTHAWRHTSDPWTPSCRGRWRGWGRGWAAHTRHRPTAEDTQPALTESRPLSRVYVAFRSKVNTRRVFLCIFSDMMRRLSLPSSLLPCSRVIDEGTECASCCLKQNTENIHFPSMGRTYQNERNLIPHLNMTFISWSPHFVN